MAHSGRTSATRSGRWSPRPARRWSSCSRSRSASAPTRRSSAWSNAVLLRPLPLPRAGPAGWCPRKTVSPAPSGRPPRFPITTTCGTKARPSTEVGAFATAPATLAREGAEPARVTAVSASAASLFDVLGVVGPPRPADPAVGRSARGRERRRIERGVLACGLRGGPGEPGPYRPPGRRGPYRGRHPGRRRGVPDRRARAVDSAPARSHRHAEDAAQRLGARAARAGPIAGECRRRGSPRSAPRLEAEHPQSNRGRGFAVEPLRRGVDGWSAAGHARAARRRRPRARSPPARMPRTWCSPAAGAAAARWLSGARWAPRPPARPPVLRGERAARPRRGGGRARRRRLGTRHARRPRAGGAAGRGHRDARLAGARRPRSSASPSVALVLGTRRRCRPAARA